MTATPGDVQAIVTRAGPLTRARMAEVEQRLAELTQDMAGPLARHAAATVQAGGKRLRPLLVFLAARVASGAQEEDGRNGDDVAALVRAAVAVELVHSATLVHDDVLDAAELRRGRPTVVAAAGREMAIAAGDLLFSRAFAELSRNGSSEQLRALSEAGSALALGELLQREDAYSPRVTVQRYLHRCTLKTARLFEAAASLGALAAGAGAALAAPLGAFGERIGLAFQLLDDVLDVSGPASRTGKHRGTDLLDGTVTLPLILARDADPQLRALDLRSLGGAEDAERTCDLIAATGALSKARERALALIAQAKQELPAALPDPARELLELVADAVVQRYS